MALPIGFHSSTPSYLDGIGDLFAQLNAQGKPIVAKNVDGTGSLFDAELYENSIPIMRISIGFPGQDDDVPRYGYEPIGEEADRFWDTAKAKFDTTGLDKTRTWIELLNEMNKDDDDEVDWIGYLCYEIAVRAVRDGYKVTLSGWSAGTPEPYHWNTDGQMKFLRYASENRSQVSVSLHEYSYNIRVLTASELIGRFELLNEACLNDLHHEPFEPPNIFITEFGWTYTEIPTHETAVSQLQRAYDYYKNFSNVKCLVIWCLDADANWGDIRFQVHQLFEPVLNIVEPGQIDMGESMPTEPSDNLLVNGNFSEGWTNTPASHGGFHQTPNGWELHYTLENEQGCFNSKNDEYSTIGVQPECIHKLNDQLPPNEQLGGSEALVLNGTAVYKIFGTGVWSAGLSQVIEGLEPGGTYRLTYNINVHYHDELGEDSPDDTQAFFELHNFSYRPVSGVNLLDTTNLPHKQWVTKTLEASPDYRGRLEFQFKLCTVWVNSRSVFIDDLSLELVSSPVDPPIDPPIDPIECPGQPRIDYARAYVLLPPAVTTPDWGTEAMKATIGTRYTVGYSADDAGVAELSDKKVFAVNPQSWGGDLDEFYNEFYPGTEVIIVNASDPADLYTRLKYYVDNGELPPTTGNPLDGLELGYLFDIPYVLTNPFNSPRSYGNGLHEGMDMDVTTAESDSKAMVLCGYYGQVTKVRRSTGAYYNYVVVHHVYNGTSFYTWYCHLDTVVVAEGDILSMGEPVGEIGDTGGNWNEHLHLNLQVPGHGLSGYVVTDVIDPAPYVKFRTTSQQGDAQASLHAQADPIDITPVEKEEFRLLDSRSIKVLSAHPESYIAQIVNNAKTAVVRAFLDWGERAITPHQFFNDTISDVERSINTLKAHGVDQIFVEMHNEPNLTAEGLYFSWNNGFQFASFMLEVLELYKGRLSPDIKYMFPGLSPGWGIEGVRYEHDTFLTQSDAFARNCDAIGAHAYWSEGFPLQTAVDHVAKFSFRFPSKPIYITEASRNDRPQVVSDNQYKLDMKEFVILCRQFGNVKDVFFFVSKALNKVFEPECWIINGVSRGFGQYLNGV